MGRVYWVLVGDFFVDFGIVVDYFGRDVDWSRSFDIGVVGIGCCCCYL